MSVAPVPRGLDLDALIDEARRRARLRRLALAAAMLAAAAAGIGSFELTRGTDPVAHAPPGFEVLKARGSVAHAVIEQVASVRLTSLAGHERPANTTEEVWYDARGGLWRDLVQVDGRVRSDRAGTCPKSSQALPCESAQSIGYLFPRPWPSPPRAGLQLIGPGTFRGRPVDWLEPNGRLVKNTSQFSSRMGLDARTHRLVVERDFWRGRLVTETTVTQKPTLSARHFSFLVRKNAARALPDGLLEPLEAPRGRLLAYGFAAARKALGRTPLWLGSRFGDYALRSVQVGTYAFGVTKTGALRPAPYVRFSYGTPVDEDYRFSVEEFGSIRPYFYKQGPRPGQIERDVYGPAMLRVTRGGLIVRISGTLLPTRAHAVAVGKALRPLQPGLKDLPSLRQQ
jgi:hypothetical protein